MHRIDLLKGQGIPAKTTSTGIVVLILTVIVPILVAVGMLDWYMRTKTSIDITAQSIDNARKMITERALDLKLQKSQEREIALLNSKLREVSRCVDTFMQWTPILMTVAKDMPQKMIMSKLEAQSTGAARRRTRGSNEPNQPLEIPIPSRTMVMNIHGTGGDNYDPVVQQFQEALNSSPVLEPRIKDIIYSRQAGIQGSGQTESHEMKIIFATESR